MAKNIVLCCDGTSNQVSQDSTNVLKISLAVKKEREKQLVYYHPGIGTRVPIGTNSVLGGAYRKALALAFGSGIKADIADAYVYLMNHFRPGDRIYMFGFSRGAYTVRALAGMLRVYGLALPGNEALVPYAVDALWKFREALQHRRVGEFFHQAKLFREAVAADPCVPHFLGLWDTVSSVGWIGSPTVLPYTRRNLDRTIIRHAIALDERRAFFRANLFDENVGSDLQQVWFPGCHADIGGGLPERDSALSKYPLEWVANEAKIAGLKFDDEKLAEILGKSGQVYVRAAPMAPNESLVGIWRAAEFVPKRKYDPDKRKLGWRLNLHRRRFVPSSPCVHDAAWEIDGYQGRIPENAVPLSRKVW